ncbi:MAG: cytochrome c3 family protein [Acidobacteriota bacterium]|nr:cytochrome c3 family protein [Acidobacteriota bacterium]
MKTKFFAILMLLCVALGTGFATTAAKPADPSKADLLAAKHSAAGITCAQCHGNAAKKQPVPASTCATCHDRKTLAESTAKMNPYNPHDNRHFGIEGDCNECHHQHKKSQNRCDECHKFNFVVP